MGDNQLIYKPFEYGQEYNVSEMVWEVFSEFEAPEYYEEGVRIFKAYIEPDRLADEVRKNGLRIFCCYDINELVGVLAIRNITHISLLFVRKSHHRRGIARELLKLAVNEAIINMPDIRKITVNSSPFAVEVYKRLGFIAANTMQVKDGIIYMPMEKTIN